MNDKLKQIFDFLVQNREFNRRVQERFYLSVIAPHSTTEEKVASLLYHVANTQSRPNINRLASFYQRIFDDSQCLNSMHHFIEKIYPDGPLNYNGLFRGMEMQSGWGKKTAALFTKSVYHAHNEHYSEMLRFWDDIPATISDNDSFFLPVDAVIIAIFNRLDKTRNWNFDSINRTLKSQYTNEQIEVWDDLWFWGFITQNGSGQQRAFEWNENKYWIMIESDKNPDTIKKVRNKAGDFLSMLS